MIKKIFTIIFILTCITVIYFAVSSILSGNKGVQASWYDASGTWTNRKFGTVNHQKVSGTTNLTDFPMLVSIIDPDLRHTSHGGKVGKTDGTDILFTSGNGTTKLSHEIEKYASTTGELIAWVKIPTLYATQNTPIYMYFGNALASDQQNVSDVWSNGYENVYHFAEGSSLNVNDSTSNARHGTNNGATQGNGFANGGANFVDTEYDFVEIPTSNQNERITVSAWVYRTIGSSTRRAIISKWPSVGNSQWQLENRVSGYRDFHFLMVNPNGSTTYVSRSTTGYIAFNEWTYVTATWDKDLDGGAIRLYSDGKEVEYASFGSRNSTIMSSTENATIGKNDTTSGREWGGDIDEVRISNIARSADWIATEYNNMSEPTKFISFSNSEDENDVPKVNSNINIASTGAPNFSWYSGSWSFAKKITVNQQKVSGDSIYGGFSYLSTAEDVSDLQTYTFPSVSFGEADSDRCIIIGTSSRRAGSDSVTLSSVTIGGVPATIIQQNTNNTSNTNITAIASAIVPSGTSGDVVVTWSHTMLRSKIGVWRAVGLSNCTSAYDSDGSTSNNPSVNLDIPANGVAIGMGTTGASTSATWAGLDENFDSVVESFSNMTGASLSNLSSQTGRVITINFGSNSAPVGSFASWEASSGNLSYGLSDFPMLVSVIDPDLRHTSHGGKVGKTDGTDILFTSGNGTTKLSHEIEKYASTTGELIAWVKIPTLYATQNTPIYMYFGNALASDQQNVSDVWSSDYKVVWHLGEGYSTASGFYKDSTSNGNHSTLIDPNGLVTANQSKIGQGLSFGPDANNHRVESLNTGISPVQNITISTWVMLLNNPATSRGIVTRWGNANSYMIEIAPSPNRFITRMQLSGGGCNCPQYGIELNKWYHAVATYDGSFTRLYVDGVLISSVAGSGTIANNNVTLKAFNSVDASGDETRVSFATKSANWIKTEYNNQYSPSTFYSYGGLLTQTRQVNTGDEAPAVKVRGGVKFR